MILLAVDPGNVCGMAEGEFVNGTIQRFRSWEESPNDCVAYFDHYGMGIDVLGYETFTPRPGVYTWQPDALYTIGALRYVAHTYGVRTIGRSPADAKKFSTNDKLTKLGWRHPTKGGHADDASRHLLLLAISEQAINLEVLL